ncbi:uncharacterized protein B0I36DRAFT_28221 [Microdochium trichocladiopsis]|uniref:Uncharacterized protein n=1 Tax=Microdochium trichocladiopsis TaxID=1682393 RepID=A0A9P9BKW7_9PEZI|nr:uncharacterized protein B0I36DRAFT_28221 [Microdochium trichocladiopsis]KAH7021042.1 hypothetical protein B0I36DRAFT_28221 [Microdochium trichocladiopsis]
MSDTDVAGANAAAPGGEDSPGVLGKQSAVKDKNCPYCGQAFTSSSLGRHLDLYVKEKNPKPPDGIHDVEAIRKMRSGITRRQPRGSLARRESSNHVVSTPPSSVKKPSPSRESHSGSVAPDTLPTAAAGSDAQLVVDNQAFKYPFQPTWEATGVILDIPAPTTGPEKTAQVDDAASQGSAASRRINQQSQNQFRNSSGRAAQKAQLEARHRLADAMDTARAAELALRELLSSLRAAKQHIDMYSQPFDFDPLSLDFPALTLQCLCAPPTLFSSIPHSTSSSWSIEPPSEKQYEALKVYFHEHFQKWKSTCATATTAVAEDFSYPMPQSLASQDLRESIRSAEAAATLLEKQIDEHLQSTFQVWESLTLDRRKELWIVELARGIGRRQKEVDMLKQQRHELKQENANLKTQIEHLNRLQQPREFRLVPPATIPIEESILSYLFGNAASIARKTIGLALDDRHLDLNAVVAIAIERWKSAIVSSRAQGMAGQKPLDQMTSLPTPTSATAPSTGRPAAQSAKAPSHVATSKALQKQVQQNQHQQEREKQQQDQINPEPIVTVDAANGEPSKATPSTAASPAQEQIATPLENGNSNNDSDEDADADMDEDEPFQPLNSVGSLPQHQALVQQQQPQQLNVAKARSTSQTAVASNTNHYMSNGTSVDVHSMNGRPVIADMGGASVALQQQSQQALYNNFGAGDGADGDAMYMD